SFIGPGAKAIAAMGDKIESKRLAIAAGVSTIPGHTEASKDAAAAVRAARQIGFPVMLKAAAGGGGKGMRIARSEQEVRDGFVSTTSEAKSSFGDDRVFVEKFIEQPRHIEIQMLADAHGNVVHLGERECSIQRRHQKVIEEAPSLFVDQAMREAMGSRAVALAKAVDYKSAGTVEFIVDQERSFYFLEMNTRLQVEHPVTEYVTGLDMVELMIRVAAGEKVPFAQEEVSFNGWAIEARIYAEDPERNFLPSSGRLVRYRPPEQNPNLRIDTGVFEGSEISIFYDPMIAKLIAGGATRDEALNRLRDGLDAYYIDGVDHNIPFLAALVRHPRFVEGRLSTDFIAEEYPVGFKTEAMPHDDPRMLVAVAATIQRCIDERDARISGQAGKTRRQLGRDYVALVGSSDAKEYKLSLNSSPGRAELEVEGMHYKVDSNWKPGDIFFRGTVNDQSLCIQVARVGIDWRLTHQGHLAMIRVLAPRAAELNRLMPVKQTSGLSKFLLSPMPGLLVRVAVQKGEEIKAGQELAVVEAMKME
ncbi:MAG: biotin/lipoyl-containing protein, partial [Woeseiaceae bacterium]